MTVDEAGTLPLPWLAAPLAQALASHRGHALLVHGTPGVGAMAFAFTLAQAWLCEGEGDGGLPRPCGHCGSCRLIQGHLHPDFTVLMPETLRREHGWPLPDDRADGDDAKRKPSKQIRIDEVRLLIERSTRTSARGRSKVALLHPADALNTQSANALLKTLEEPAPGTRLLLTTSDPAALLPTVRSRCQLLRLNEPAAEAALGWLKAQGVTDTADAQVLLSACSGRPLDALAMLQAGVTARAWAALPAAVAAGNAAALAGWPVPRALDALQKLCHDALARATGGAARYFPSAGVPGRAALRGLAAWSRELERVARHAEHPWSEALLIEALVRGGAEALAPGPKAGRAPSRGLDTLVE
ncbi:MAG: DNA polymerase III subunit delta' [Leptothrix sp. (in: Bacteria)]|nr:DNA polymerase III subunit delta' [Leptothrix sp. (in: b-proteobacteria)]